MDEIKSRFKDLTLNPLAISELDLRTKALAEELERRTNKLSDQFTKLKKKQYYIDGRVFILGEEVKQLKK
jgi:hypothetical protein